MSKEERFACESELSEEELINELNKILKLDIHRDKVLWSFDDYTELNIYTNSIKSMFNLNSFEELTQSLNYKKNEDLTYTADFTDSFVQNIFCLSYMFLNHNFV